MQAIAWNWKRAAAGQSMLLAVLIGAGLTIAPPCSAQQAAGRDSVPLQSWSVKQAGDRTPSAAATTANAMSDLLFIGTTPCRLMDTRAGSGMATGFGAPSLAAMTSRKLIVPNSACGLPAAAAYSLYIASVSNPGVPVGWVDAWSGDIAEWPGTVVLNAVQGGVVGTSAIVAAGADGSIQLQSSQGTDVVIDVNGYWIQRASLNFRGLWSASLSYAAGDVVTQPSSGGSYGPVSSYAALAANSGINPYSDVAAQGAAWELLSPAGGAGADGVQGPAGPAGADGAAGAPGAAGAMIMIANVATNNTATFFYIPLMGSGDPATADKTFAAQSTVMPMSCTITKMYVAGSSNSQVSIGFHIWRSAGGTGAPKDTGAFVAAGRGAESSGTLNLAVNAGDRLAYLITPGAPNQRLEGTGGIICR
jgi:hypothetical protein